MYTFKGKQYIVPGAAASIAFDSQPEVVGTGVGTVLVVADANAGEDYTTGKVYSFSNTTQAKDALQGGIGLEAVKAAFLGSAATGGANRVLFVKTNVGFASKLAIPSSIVTDPSTRNITFDTSANDGVIKFSFRGEPAVEISSDYVNALRNYVASNFGDGLVTVTDNNNSTITVAAKVSGIANSSYLHNWSSTEGPVTAPSGSIKFLAKVKGSGVRLSINYDTDTKLFTVLYNGAIVGMIKLPNNTASALQGILTGSATNTSDENKANAASINQFLTIDGTPSGNLTSTGGNIPSVCSTKDTPRDGDAFERALNITAKWDKNFVVSPHTDSWVAGYISSYCQRGSEFRCQGFCGFDKGKKIKDAFTESTSNSAYVSRVYGEVTSSNISVDGSTVTYGSGMSACLVAGAIASLSPEEPLTAKTILADKVDYDTTAQRLAGYELATDLEIQEAMINNGILLLAQTEDRGVYVVKGINSLRGQAYRQLLGGDNLSHELSIMRIVFQIEKDWVTSARKVFPGSNILKPSAAQVKTFTANYLSKLIGTLLVDYDTSSLQVSLSQDAWITRVGMTINSPINHAFLDATMRLATIAV